MPLDPLGSDSITDAAMGEVSRSLTFWGPDGHGPVWDLVSSPWLSTGRFYAGNRVGRPRCVNFIKSLPQSGDGGGGKIETKFRDGLHLP